MWWYEQISGNLFHNSESKGVCYSGTPGARNNPVLQDQKYVGPIPRGVYRMGEPFDSPVHGPYCIRLFAMPENQMFGRDGFLIHGDKIGAPGTASQGCIVRSPKADRQMIWESGDHMLVVY